MRVLQLVIFVLHTRTMCLTRTVTQAVLQLVISVLQTKGADNILQIKIHMFMKNPVPAHPT